MKRIRDVAAGTSLLTAVLAVALAGCSALSESITTQPYQPADGTNVSLPGTAVALRNMLVIGGERGEPATVIGSVVNSGYSAVEVRIQSDLGETAQPVQTTVRVGPKAIVRIGPGGTSTMEIPQLPVEPGAVTGFSAGTAGGGRLDFTVPVLPPAGDYATYTPSAPATGTPSESAGAGDEVPSPSASGTASVPVSATATDAESEAESGGTDEQNDGETGSQERDN